MKLSPMIVADKQVNLFPVRLAWSALVILLVLFPQPAKAQWALVWNDEFNGVTNAAPDSTKWAYDSPTAGSGNNELQTYCGQSGAGQTGDCTNWQQNARLDGNGNLAIAAIKNAAGNWTSARLYTRGKFTFTYGRAEARMKLPVGAGLWPAWWMLGANLFTGTPWPNCGELDLMENVPELGPAKIRSSLHGTNYSGANSLHGDFTFPGGGRIDAGYHTYGVIWTNNLVQYYVDDYTKPFVTFTPANMPAGGVWAFNSHPFFLLLNLAVGGDWPGNPNTNTPNPALMSVDYVRVYTSARPAAIGQLSPWRSNTNLVFSFQSQSGQFYQVEYKTNLWDNSWLPSSTVTGNGSVQTVAVPLTFASRFFRLRIQ